MNKSLAIKLLVILGLTVLLLVPLAFISGLTNERERHRDEVVKDIAASSANEQQITGPLLVVPYVHTVRTWTDDPKTGQRVQRETEERGALHFLPERLDVTGKLRTERRFRGIYEARLYTLNGRLAGHFVVPADYGLPPARLAEYRLEAPTLALGISDVRGIRNDVPLLVNGQPLRFEAGSGSAVLGTGLHATVPMAARHDFQLDLTLQGTSALHFTPVARETRVKLASDWPHPSFTGDFLPVERQVTATGFNALWQASFFSTNIQQLLVACADDGACEGFNGRRFSVSFIDPVDHYAKMSRAVNYALLFVTLTFAAFFLFEVLRRLAIHPVQYGLVGIALALFFLLLLSLSEHIGFTRAYVVSAAACVGLLGYYIRHILGGFARGAGFAAGLAALYGLLFLLLRMEDYALLVGSLLLFGTLAVVMVLTRHIDWFNVGQRPLPAALPLPTPPASASTTTAAMPPPLPGATPASPPQGPTP
jgi:inner membrane protein